MEVIGIEASKSIGNVDLLSNAMLENPYPTYRYLRENDPVHKSSMLGGSWVVTKYEDVLACLKDHPLDDIYASSAKLMSFAIDMPGPKKFRRLLQGKLTISKLSSWEQYTKKVISRILSELESEDYIQVEVVSHVATALSGAVIAKLLGLSLERMDKVLKNSLSVSRFMSQANPTEKDLEIVSADIDLLEEIFREVMEERRIKPEDDLISHLVGMQEKGEDLSDEELLGILIFLLPAGQDTTSNLISSSLLSLAQNPDQKKFLIENPEKVQEALNELMRYESPIQWLGRVATQDFMLGDQRIKAKDRLVLFLGSANRDPNTFINPDQLLLNRDPKNHLAFAFGKFFCIGSHLARLECGLLLNSLLKHIEFKIPDQENESWEWSEGSAFRKLSYLNLDMRSR